MKIRARVPESFSGTHPYRADCAKTSIVEEWMLDGIDATEHAECIAGEITSRIHDEVCPRCTGPLYETSTDYGAGSRVTPCRCVVICSRCGADEANEGIVGRGLSQFWRWPVRKSDITKRANKLDAMTTRTKAVIDGSTGKPLVLTEDGVAEVEMRPGCGGWAEFGMDEEVAQ